MDFNRENRHIYLEGNEPKLLGTPGPLSICEFAVYKGAVEDRLETRQAQLGGVDHVRARNAAKQVQRETDARSIDSEVMKFEGEILVYGGLLSEMERVSAEIAEWYA